MLRIVSALYNLTEREWKEEFLILIHPKSGIKTDEPMPQVKYSPHLVEDC
jgi:hypothetical protein